ncbi:MAG: hypothetical protein HRT89_12440 [Lentisphaeria bacterium]|nr:hypothetical protein [Lentisphaeria bacterium]NQZ68865.1 hypothetical protein [Lentisphaeria bacterium]
MLNKILNLFRKKEPQWYEPDDPTPREQCPCCDYISLPERGNYLICRLCFWEDDGQDIDELDEESGPNHGITLREGRTNFNIFGACEEKMVQYVVSIEERSQYEHKPRKIE